MRYLCLLRGVNVGGKNKLPMAGLRKQLSEAGFKNVSSYINSGNILLESDMGPDKVSRLVESIITSSFKLDSELIKTCALSIPQLEQIVQRAPGGFGSQPEMYHSDVLFPMDGATSADIMSATHTNPDVDAAWEQNGVVYYQRLSALRTKSRLSRIMESPVYKSTTIRSWNTTNKLLELMNL